MRPLDEKPIKLLRKRLDAAGLDAHLEALAAGAQAIEIRVKHAVAHHSEATTEPLDVVGKRLRAGELVAVQIYFFQDDDWWCDTLMQGADGFRLVRMRQGVPRP